MPESGRGEPGIRTALPKLLDQYRLLSKPVGDRKADDAWIERLCQTIYASDRDQAADAVAAALAEGFSTDDVAEAICLAANRLVLRDPGRERGHGDKPAGSVHGASVGVHASDAANAWRQESTATISIAIAPSGQAVTHAGDWPSSRRPWHMSHFPTTPRSALYCGTPYEQFHVQY